MKQIKRAASAAVFAVILLGLAGVAHAQQGVYDYADDFSCLTNWSGNTCYAYFSENTGDYWIEAAATCDLYEDCDYQGSNDIWADADVGFDGTCPMSYDSGLWGYTYVSMDGPQNDVYFYVEGVEADAWIDDTAYDYEWNDCLNNGGYDRSNYISCD
jgi:hypothetical protein